MNKGLLLYVCGGILFVFGCCVGVLGSEQPPTPELYTEYDCRDYIRRRPGDEWVRIKNARLNLPATTYTSLLGSMCDLYVPAFEDWEKAPGSTPSPRPGSTEAPSKPPGLENETVVLILRTTASDLMSIVREVKAFDSEHKQGEAYLWALKNWRRLAPQRELQGRARRVGSFSDADWKALSLIEHKDANAIVIDESQRPVPWSGRCMQAVGTMMALFSLVLVLAGFARRSKEQGTMWRPGVTSAPLSYVPPNFVGGPTAYGTPVMGSPYVAPPPNPFIPGGMAVGPGRSSPPPPGYPPSGPLAGPGAYLPPLPGFVPGGPPAGPTGFPPPPPGFAPSGPPAGPTGFHPPPPGFAPSGPPAGSTGFPSPPPGFAPSGPPAGSTGFPSPPPGYTPGGPLAGPGAYLPPPPGFAPSGPPAGPTGFPPPPPAS